MKKYLLIALSLTTLAAQAGTTYYQNENDCKVEVEETTNGTLIYINQLGSTEFLGFTKDYKSGNFSYCDSKALEINSFEGSQGKGVMLACSAHQNGHGYTRGRADLEFMHGDLVKVKIEGQIRRLIWMDDQSIECDNLVKQK